MFLLGSETKRNISKMKKQRNDFQLKDQENFPEGTSNEADLFRLIDTEFKKGGNENTERIKKGY